MDVCYPSMVISYYYIYCTNYGYIAQSMERTTCYQDSFCGVGSIPMCGIKSWLCHLV